MPYDFLYDIWVLVAGISPLIVTILVVGYFIVDFPIGLAMKVFPANCVFGAAMVIFGLSAALVPVSGGYGGLMGLRFLLGCGEGVFTMGFMYLSQWYKPEELALRTGMFQCTNLHCPTLISIQH